MGLITHSGSSTIVFNPRCRPEGSREIPRQRLPSVEQRRARPAQPTVLPHALRYVLKFEKSNPRTCEFFNKREVAKNGNSSYHRSTSHSTIQKWNAPSSSHFLQPIVRTSYQSPSLSQLPTLGAYTSRSIQASTSEREKRNSREEVLLRRVPEDGDAMEFHSTSFSQRNSQCLSDQEGERHDSLSRTPVLRSIPQNFEGQSPVMGDEEQERWLDEHLVRQGLYHGTPPFSNTFISNSHSNSMQALIANLSSCTV